MSLPLLDIEGVSMRFGGLTVLADVHLSVPEGGIHGLIGPNGAGKTTLFNLITGVLAPGAGSIRFRGTAIAGLPQHEICRRGVSRTFQNIRLFRQMSLVENVLVGMHARLDYGPFEALRRAARFRRAEAAARTRARELLAWVGLHDRAEQQAGQLSYGDQRKLELARALAAEPALLLLDEPAAGMNTGEKLEMMAQVRRIADRGYTVLLIDHDMQFVMGLCEEIAVLNFGKVIAQGPGERIRRHPDVVGGEQQMLAIGRALMARPRVLLLDEPSMGLAPIVVQDIFRTLRRINAQGVTMLLVEQNVRQALRIADYGYVLETGTIALEGTGGQLLHDPQVRKAYLGG